MNIPMPRAKIGDIVVFGSTQVVIISAEYREPIMEKKCWRYKNTICREIVDGEIIMNLTTGVDYQERINTEHNGVINFKGKIKVIETMADLYMLIPEDEMFVRVKNTGQYFKYSSLNGYWSVLDLTHF